MHPSHVMLLLSLIHLCIAGISMKELDTVLKEAAGVYTDSNKSLKEGLTKTVVLTAVNTGYVDFAFNLQCYMNRLNMKLLVFAEDKDAYHHLSPYMYSFAFDEGIANVTGEKSHWRDVNYYSVVIR